jgi:hypothetical protein
MRYTVEKQDSSRAMTLCRRNTAQSIFYLEKDRHTGSRNYILDKKPVNRSVDRRGAE